MSCPCSRCQSSLPVRLGLGNRPLMPAELGRRHLLPCKGKLNHRNPSARHGADPRNSQRKQNGCCSGSSYACGTTSRSFLGPPKRSRSPSAAQDRTRGRRVQRGVSRLSALAEATRTACETRRLASCGWTCDSVVLARLVSTSRKSPLRSSLGLAIGISPRQSLPRINDASSPALSRLDSERESGFMASLPHRLLILPHPAVPHSVGLSSSRSAVRCMLLLGAVRKPHGCQSLALPPAPPTMHLVQQRAHPDASAGRDGLNVFDLADDLELHRAIVGQVNKVGKPG